MTKAGFTLIELLVAIALMAIIASIASLNWSSLKEKSGIESQIRMIHADIMALRAEALFNKRSRTAVIGTRSFSIYSSAEVTATAMRTKNFTYPMIWNSGGSTITFDTSGLASGSEKTICIVPVDTTVVNDANVDSLVVAAARINLAKRNGGDCVSSNNSLIHK